MDILQAFIENLEEMKNIDVKTVELDTLVDIQDICINTMLPQLERLIDFIIQIKNPYCFRYDNTVIKICFMETEATIEDQFEYYLAST